MDVGTRRLVPAIHSAPVHAFGDIMKLASRTSRSLSARLTESYRKKTQNFMDLHPSGRMLNCGVNR